MKSEIRVLNLSVKFLFLSEIHLFSAHYILGSLFKHNELEFNGFQFNCKKEILM